MSDTTSFLGGAALAGLAAVILLKGGVSANSPLGTVPMPTLQPLPTATMPPYGSVPPSIVPPSPTTYDLEKQRLETDQLKAIVEQQRVQTEQLKAQVQSQQALIETLNKNSLVPLPPKTHQGQPTSLEPSNPMVTGVMWALGGMVLAFGGGIALVGVFVLLARQQRPSRTIEVVHDDYSNYIPATNRRRSQMLPPRRVIKRVDAQDLE
ncbi:MAG: DUF3450 domain-containing protein [Leptolyngbyaceae cyanobacterium CSU_1_3]|nr:DUF3450 domain-containing protein [Leptolyngbyaceae cyanobacterium CSU_1_3]